MFASLILAAAVSAAPVPKDATPAGPPPRVMDLAPGPDNKVRVQVYRTEVVKMPVQGINPPNNAPVPEREITTRRLAQVELIEVKDLTVFTADGKEADKAVLKKLATEGGVVVVSADGKKVDPKYLKLFRDDVLILVSPELVTPTGAAGRSVVAPMPAQLRVLPAPAVPLPANPPPPNPPKK